MNVVKEDYSEKQRKLKIFYITIISICVVAIMVAFIVQLKQEQPSSGVGEILPELSDDKISVYKQQFNEIFENKVNYLENNAYKINEYKISDAEEIVYLGYQNKEKKANDYELDVNIPYINIDTDVVEEFNKQIKDVFEKKAKSVLNTKNSNIIYDVNYSAYVSNNILSLVIRSTLKEGGNPQRDIVQTYNYDLIKHEKCTIDDMLQIKGITKKEAGQKIKDEIKSVGKRVEELGKLGYSVYARDYTSDIYNINNVTEYFLGKDNALYIIYAYGNLNHTSEMDIVVM